MFPLRRSLRFSITLGVVMILLVVALTVGWIVLSVIAALTTEESRGVYWAMLSVGTVFLVLVLAGVVAYLSLSIKTINLGRRQSNFIDSVTHELKSPVASLKLYLQTLSRRQLSHEEQAKFLRDMLEDVDRLDELINHVLDAARVEQGAAAAPAENVELAALAGRVAATVAQRHNAPPGTVTLDLTPCTVTGSAGDLEMILRNLIDNAVKYAGQPPRVLVSVRLVPLAEPASRQDGWAVIRVQDNGPGVPRQMRRRIFRRFVRLGSELERTKPGTGLGLYIVGTLVRRLKGKIRVLDPPVVQDEPSMAISGSPGGPGTVFEIMLPGARPATVPAEAVATHVEAYGSDELELAASRTLNPEP